MSRSDVLSRLPFMSFKALSFRPKQSAVAISLPLPIMTFKVLSFRPERSAAEKPASRRGLALIRSFIISILFAAALLCAAPAHAQGCTQCRDNTAATPPATQRAYRHAIILMVVAGGTLFLTTVALLRRPR